MIKSEYYIVIQGRMLNDLKLKGNELLIYACIFGFSQDGGGYNGGLTYLSEWTNSTKQGVIKNLKSLLEKGYITKSDFFINGVNIPRYKAVLNKAEGGVKQSLTGIKQSLTEYSTEFNGGIKQSLTNNIIDNKIINKYERIFKNYYGVNKGVDKSKCNKLLDNLLKQGITLDDIKTSIILYNSECRIKGEYRYVKKLENRLREYQPLNQDQIDETLGILTKQHREKINTDDKYKNGLGKTVWTDLCDTFGKEKMNVIWKNGNRTIKLTFT